MSIYSTTHIWHLTTFRTAILSNFESCFGRLMTTLCLNDGGEDASFKPLHTDHIYSANKALSQVSHTSVLSGVILHDIVFCHLFRVSSYMPTKIHLKCQ